MKDVNQEFQDKCEYLERNGYTVHAMWACQWRVRREDPDVAPFVEGLNLQKPLDIKNAFKGGRTNASKLSNQITGKKKFRKKEFRRKTSTSFPCTPQSTSTKPILLDIRKSSSPTSRTFANILESSSVP